MKLQFLLASVALLVAPLLAQNGPSDSGSGSLFQPSDQLKNAASESLTNAVKNISDSFAQGNANGAAFWWANDSQTIVQNFTLNTDQVVSFYSRTLRNETSPSPVAD